MLEDLIYRLSGALRGAVFGALGALIGAIIVAIIYRFVSKSWKLGPVAVGALIGLIVTQSSEIGVGQLGQNIQQNTVRPKIDKWALQRALLDHEYYGDVYRAIKTHEPKLFEETTQIIVSSTEGTSTEKLIGQLRQKLFSQLQSRAAYLSDTDLVELFAVSADMTRELSEHDPFICLQFATGEIFGDISKMLSSELLQRDKALTLKMVEVKPRELALIDASQAVSINNKIAERLYMQFGSKLDLISGTAVPPESHKDACLIYSEYSRQVASLASLEAADLIRIILIEPDRLDNSTQGAMQ